MPDGLRLYGSGLTAGASAGLRARLRDGPAFALAVERWMGPADAIDQQLLAAVDGPVLDVGCGPGRHLHALAARGVFALGVDLSPVAVSLAVGRGGRAIVADVFGELPGAGSWRTGLLLDGNVGIGGAPHRLLARLAALLSADGQVLVELEPPGGGSDCTEARLELGDTVSAWFPWAQVAVGQIDPVARAGGFEVEERFAIADRWFARLRRTTDRHSRREPPPGSG